MKDKKERTSRCKHCGHWMPIDQLTERKCWNCGKDIRGPKY